MNIGILRNTFLPISETFIINQIKSLVDTNVHVLTREVVNTDYFNFEGLDITSVVNTNDQKAKQKMDRLFYTMGRKSNKLNQSIKKNNIQLLHAHFGVEGVYGLPLAIKHNIPLVTTFHGYDITRLPKFTLTPISWFNYYLYVNSLKEKGSLFIAVSNYIKKQLIKNGFPEDKIKVHYIGIDVDHIPYIQRKPKDVVTIIAVGRLTEKKGTLYLINAFDKLYKKNKKIQLKLIGEGPLKEQLQSHVQTLESKHQIKFFGQIHNQKVIEEMLDSDIFCLPSVTASDGDQEGLGMVQLEAAATGLPIVASDSGGISDAIIDGTTGYLTEEKNVRQLAERLERLIESRDLRLDVGLAARKHMEKNFNIKIQGEKLSHLYKELL